MWAGSMMRQACHGTRLGLSDVIAGSSSMNHHLLAAGIGLQVGRATVSRAVEENGLLTVRRLDPRHRW